MTFADRPSALRIKAFAQAQATLEGSTPLQQFERLWADCVHEPAQESAQEPSQVDWTARGFTKTDTGGTEHIWLHLQARASVPLICQRCLKPVQVALLVARDFRFVPDEATALAEDDESPEDLLVLSPEFDLLSLLEDELLMDLPLVPMHEICDSEHLHTKSGPMDEDVAEKPNPFAVLAALKAKQGD